MDNAQSPDGKDAVFAFLKERGSIANIADKTGATQAAVRNWIRRGKIPPWWMGHINRVDWAKAKAAHKSKSRK